jgi:hypothetical protein
MPGTAPLSDDLLELIDLFISHGVEFLVVGAHAFAVHAYPRQTQDLDLWVRRSAENATRIRLALDEFGFSIGDEGERQLTLERNMLQLGHPPNRVDILTFLDGCEFDSAVGRLQRATIVGRELGVLGLKDFLATKRVSGRAKDLDDINRLREHYGSLPDE